MDNFTRVYAVILAVAIVAGLFFLGKSSYQPEVAELNRVLKADPVIAEYAYQFRVKSFADGKATIWSPRSFDVPAIQFLGIIHPEVAGLAQDDPRMLAAQQELINHQKHAMGVVGAQKGVTAVDWALDVKWLADHGVVASGGSR